MSGILWKKLECETMKVIFWTDNKTVRLYQQRLQKVPCICWWSCSRNTQTNITLQVALCGKEIQPCRHCFPRSWRPKADRQSTLLVWFWFPLECIWQLEFSPWYPISPNWWHRSKEGLCVGYSDPRAQNNLCVARLTYLTPFSWWRRHTLSWWPTIQNSLQCETSCHSTEHRACDESYPLSLSLLSQTSGSWHHSEWDPIIIGGSSVVSSDISRCVSCRKLRGSPQGQKMALSLLCPSISVAWNT